LQALQWQRLQQVMARAEDHASTEIVGNSRISVGDLRSLDDVRRLPVTTKQDLREEYPYGFLCVPAMRSCGSMCPPVHRPGYRDFLFAGRYRVWADLMARCMYMTGARPGMCFKT